MYPRVSRPLCGSVPERVVLCASKTGSVGVSLCVYVCVGLSAGPCVLEGHCA